MLRVRKREIIRGSSIAAPCPRVWSSWSDLLSQPPPQPFTHELVFSLQEGRGLRTEFVEVHVTSGFANDIRHIVHGLGITNLATKGNGRLRDQSAEGSSGSRGRHAKKARARSPLSGPVPSQALLSIGGLAVDPGSMPLVRQLGVSCAHFWPCTASCLTGGDGDRGKNQSDDKHGL